MTFTGAYVLTRALKACAYGAFCVFALGWVVEHCGDREVDVVMHVCEPNVVIDLGSEHVVIDEAPKKPLRFELRPGAHEFSVSRDGVALFKETVEAVRGTTLVLAAYDPAMTGTAPVPHDRVSRADRGHRRGRRRAE